MPEDFFIDIVLEPCVIDDEDDVSATSAKTLSGARGGEGEVWTEEGEGEGAELWKLLLEYQSDGPLKQRSVGGPPEAHRK